MNTKDEKYAELFPQIKSILEGETDMIANMANVAAVLHEEFKFWWTGFYRVVGEDTLLLGPFQGPLACTRIKKGRGVCGTAWEENTTQVVPDVHLFPGHIACSSLSRSEIVVPVRDNKGKIWAVLDIDSINLREFDEIDKEYLEQVATLLSSWG